MTTIPCFAAVATARGELSKKKFRGTILFWLATSFIVSSMAYLILAKWWFTFIFAAAFACLGCGIFFMNKKKDLKEAGIN